MAGVGALSEKRFVPGGTTIDIGEVRFTYQGPAMALHIGIGWKGQGGGFFGGLDFDNGGKLLNVKQATAFVTVEVPETPSPQNMGFVVAGTIWVPFPQKYGTRDGGEVTINLGDLKSWIWAVDGRKVSTPTYPEAMREDNLLFLQVDSSVPVHVLEPTDSGEE